MNKRQKARLALEILKSRGDGHRFARFTDEEAEDNADEIIQYVWSLLIKESSALINALHNLGFTNKQIADRIADCVADRADRIRIVADESTLSRAHSKSPDLQIALSSLRDLGDSLKIFLMRARSDRISKSLTTSPVTAIGFCRNGARAVSDEDKLVVAKTVLSNLIFGLSGNTELRIPLPDGFQGALVRIGDWRYGLRLYQSEGQSDAVLLMHEIHELEEMLNRMKDDLARIEKTDREYAPARARKPKSAF